MEDVRIVTHRHIAAKVGCDRSAVSLALRGSPRIGVELARRIRDTAEELGYRPDPMISRLARHRWSRNKIGLDPVLAYLVDSKRGAFDLQRRFLRLAQARAEKLGYALAEFDLAGYPNIKAANRVLCYRGIRGLLVPALAKETEEDLQQLELDRFAIVRCSLGWACDSYHVVAPDFFGGTRLVWQKAVARGYRRIGAALSRHTPLAVEDDARLAASQLEQFRLVAPADRIPFLLSDPLDRDAFLRWFEEHKPDMVIGFVHDIYDWLKTRGLRVPEDVAFACLLRRPHQSFSGIDPQTPEVGRQAVDLLVAQIEANKFGVPEIQQLVLLEPKWEEGSTLPLRSKPVGKPPVSLGSA